MIKLNINISDQYCLIYHANLFGLIYTNYNYLYLKTVEIYGISVCVCVSNLYNDMVMTGITRRR